MPFPLSIDGRLTFRNEGTSPVDAERVAVRIEEILEHTRSRGITRDGTSIGFKVPLFSFRLIWDPLVSTNGGRIYVSAGSSDMTIAYTLGMTRLVIVATIMLAAMIAVIVGNEQLPSGFILFVPIAWLWLAGGNYLITKFRFPRWMERQLRKKPLFDRS